jgi:hypothetical protein
MLNSRDRCRKAYMSLWSILDWLLSAVHTPHSHLTQKGTVFFLEILLLCSKNFNQFLSDEAA